MYQQDIIRFLSGLKIRLVEMNRLTMILVVFGLGVGSVLAFNMMFNGDQRSSNLDSIEQQIRILEARIDSLPNSSSVASSITRSSSSQSEALERLEREFRQLASDREYQQWIEQQDRERERKFEDNQRAYLDSRSGWGDDPFSTTQSRDCWDKVFGC